MADYIKVELVSHDTPITLDGVIDRAIRTDLRIQARTQRSLLPRARGGAAAVNSASLGQQIGDPEPMQLGRTSLSLEEKERRRKSNLCLYCGAAGHYVSSYPAKARAHQ